MKEKIEMIHKHNTLILADRPINKNVIDVNGSIEQNGI